MAEQSFFTDKDLQPDETALAEALGKAYQHWKSLKNHVLKGHPGAAEEWNYSRLGWNCRLKGRKSVIIYLMPCSGYFRASMVFGAKATEAALTSDISPEIKQTITEAKVYAEGRGFRVDVKNAKVATDIKKLIDLKLAG